jgi:hypothetical protein
MSQPFARHIPSPAPPLRAVPLLVLVLAFLAQLALALNPGYFSHDELQWGAAADVPGWAALPWFPWTDPSMLQWRPLTFNAWLLLSQALFESPRAMHSLWVLMGSGIAAGLSWLLMRLGLGWRVAAAAGLAFALNPYAAYVHGWVGTLADLLWVGLSLVLATKLHAMHQHAAAAPQDAGPLALRAGAWAFALTALALLAKESALVMPTLVGLAWLVAGRSRVLGAATLGSGLAAVAYLALRAGTLLAPAESSGYALAPAAAPLNFAAYALYLPVTGILEVETVWLRSNGQVIAATLLMLGLAAAVLRASPRLGLAMVAGAALSVAPVLVLPHAATQYGYGFSLWLVACTALAWPRLGRAARCLVVLLLVLLTWHGARVQSEMRAVGERQAVFQPSLAAALAKHEGPLKLLRDRKFGWAYARLTHAVPAWRGQAIGDRVVWVEDAAEADYRVAEDGGLVAP